MIDMPDDRTPFERIASTTGDNSAEVAALDRVFAGLREVAVVRLVLDLHAHEAAGALRNFADAWAASEERITTAEAIQVAAHPDLAELNVRLDALYDPPTR